MAEEPKVADYITRVQMYSPWVTILDLNRYFGRETLSQFIRGTYSCLFIPQEIQPSYAGFSEFVLNFLKTRTAQAKHVYRSLVKKELLPVVQGRELEKRQYEEILEMAGYLKTYMEGLQTPKAAEMLFRIAEEIGISDEGLFAVEALLLESVRMVVGHRRGYYGYYSSSRDFSGVDLVRPFLSVEDHRKLFWILERHTFLNYPDQYLSFLTGVLSKEDHLLWFPKEEARKVFLAISEAGRKKGMENLRKIYLTEDELEELKLKRQEKEKRRLMLEQRRRKEAIRKDFDWRVAKSRGTDTQFAELYDYVERYCREREEKKEKCYITKRYLCSLFQRNPCMLLEREEAGSLCKLLRFLFLKEELTFEEMKRMLDCVEVEEERKEAA